MVAALALIRRDGADKFSMRQLAKELGVTPMSIYYYVGNKDKLFEHVGDAVLARVPRSPPTGRNWREELKVGAVEGFRLLSEYPGLSGQIIKRPPSQQSAELARHGISILVTAGFERGLAARITTTCQAFMFGMIGLQAQLERKRGGKRPANPAEAAYYERLDVHELVGFGLDALLRGIADPAARVPRGKPSRATAAGRRSVALKA